MAGSSSMPQVQQQQQEMAPPALLPGFRFYPTDDDLLGYYLTRAVHGDPHSDVIATIDAYRHDPWKLPALARIGDEQVWFFLVPRNRTAGRLTNRKSDSGFWKPSGPESPVRSSRDPNRPLIGYKRTQVFYLGPRPGNRTNWVLVEYRLPITTPPENDTIICKLYMKERAPAAAVPLNEQGGHAAVEAQAAGRFHGIVLVAAESSSSSPAAPAPSGHGHGAPAPREGPDAEAADMH